ncbi:MAG TPA: hypothetical protein VMV23_07075 [Candidatus Nanopelagicaceae bacterium]|nr:hypothetical protein [Candidatus Nanopelagicaceae bacterium]
MILLRILGLLAGLVLTLGTLGSVVQTVIVPRPTSSRLSNLIASLVLGMISTLARTRADYLRRDAILAQGAPLFLVVRLVVWIGLLVLGFTLLFWGSSVGDLAACLRLSASSILPLGLTHATSGLATAIAFLESAAGVIVVALQIAYLPSLYSSFNRRETLVTMLNSSSGSPPWGPEILARHALIDNQDHLTDLYHDWEQWAADIAESHTSYATLLYFRSPEPRTSWVLALLACMDAASMQLALNPLTAPASARPFLRMGIVCLRSIADVTNIPFPSDPMPDDPIEITAEEFQEAVERVLAVGWEPERSGEDAWPHFRGWRVNYESTAYRLASLIDAPPGPWSGTRRGQLESSMIPLRPPHRAPARERDQLLKVTRKRQAYRRAGGVAALPQMEPSRPPSNQAPGPAPPAGSKGPV